MDCVSRFVGSILMDCFFLICDVGSKEFVAVFANNESQFDVKCYVYCLVCRVDCDLLLFVLHGFCFVS